MTQTAGTGSRASHNLAWVVMAAALLASCSSDASACEPASATYRELFRDGSMTGEPVTGDVLVKDSAVRGAWYIVAKVDGSAAVWATDRDPRASVTGHISDANSAAQRTSNFEFVDGPMSRSTLAQAGGDPPRIRAAEACILG